MVLAQIDRLKKDATELEIYARKLVKRGQESRAAKILKKREFIQRQLDNVVPANSP